MLERYFKSSVSWAESKVHYYGSVLKYCSGESHTRFAVIPSTSTSYTANALYIPQ